MLIVKLDEEDVPWWLGKPEGYLMRDIYQGNMSMQRPDNITPDMFREYLEFYRVDCPRCNGKVWSGEKGKWIRTRITVDMVCELCGTDYAKGI